MLCFGAYGKSGDGNELLEDCIANEKSVEERENFKGSFYSAGICFGTVNGIMETVAIMSLTSTSIGIKACIPAEVTTGQAVRVTIKFLRDNPSELHESGVILTMLALAKAYPCK